MCAADQQAVLALTPSLRPSRFLSRIGIVDRVWLGIGAFLLAVLFASPRSVGEPLGLRRFLTPAASSEWTIAQRFRMNANGLNGVEVRFAAVAAVSGRYQLTLSDRQAVGVERLKDVAAADLVRAPSYVFRFDPIDDSLNHEFELRIMASSHKPGSGVAAWATKGSSSEVSLLINNRPRWASLAFQTHTPAVSLVRALLHTDHSERPPQWLALVGLVASWIALRFVLKAVSAADVSPGEVGTTSETDIPGGPVSSVARASTSPDALAEPPFVVR
jgi:hypothetical protein